MIPGEIRTAGGNIGLNAGRRRVDIVVTHTGDRPVQVGSHAHFFEVNRALRFERAKAFGMRLDIPSGTAVRFEPGERRPMTLVAFGGNQRAYGMNGIASGEAKAGGALPEAVLARLRAWEGGAG